MTVTTAFLAAALVVSTMPPPVYDDCEVVTNCVFDASRNDAKEFSVRIELDATPSNGVEIVFGRDADGDGRLSRTEAEMAVGYWQLATPPPFLFDPTWNAAKIVRRGQSDPNLRVECSVDNEPLVMYIR